MFIFTAVVASLAACTSAEVFARISPPYNHAFQLPLPIPSVKQPLTSYTNPETGASIDFYEVEVRPFKHNFFPDLPGSADLVGYDGFYPGPTFRVDKGRESVVRFINKGPQKSNVHLHGSLSRSPWDGWGDDWMEPGQFKDYYYPNSVHRTLWYHDHTHHESTINMYKGLLGMYQIVDSKLDEKLGLPSGNKYDVPLVLTAHYFTRDGGLSDERTQKTSIYGDTYLVNGQIQPYLAVEPRKYRFRVLNAAISRVFNLTLMHDSQPVPMSVIGSDGGYRQTPAATNNLMAGMADRWEIVVDFAPFIGKNITLTTKNAWTDTAYAGVDEMLRFVVGKAVSDETRNAALPARFNYNMKFPTEVKIAAERTFKLDSHMDRVWGMNGVHMDDVMSRVLMRPPLGTVEKYTFKSTGMGRTTAGRTSSADPSFMADGKPETSSMSGMGNMGSHHGGSAAAPIPSAKVSPEAANTNSGGMGNMAGHHSGGNGMAGMNMRSVAEASSQNLVKGNGGTWTHAMHVHLVDLQLISRKREDPSKPEGRDYLEDYEKGSIKDTVLLGSNEVIEVLVKFQPYPGVYMFHCHNSVHGDQGMMSVFNVTRLADLGYKELEMHLEDPMDARFRAKAYTGTSLDEIKSTTLPFFAGLKAYSDPAVLEDIESKYWSSRTPPSGADTGPLLPKGRPGMGMGGSSGSSSSSSSSSSSISASPTTGGMPGMSGGMSSHHGGGGMAMGMRMR